MSADIRGLPETLLHPPASLSLKVAVVVVVALMLAVGSVLYVLSSGTTREAPIFPIGHYLAFAGPTVVPITTVTGIPCTGPAPSQCYGYSFQVTKVDRGISWNDIGVLVSGPHGQNPIPAGSASRAGIAGYAGCPGPGQQTKGDGGVVYWVGPIVNSTWSRGAGSGSTVIEIGQVLVVYVAGSTSNSDPLAGDSLVVVAAGQFSGSAATPIP